MSFGGFVKRLRVFPKSVTDVNSWPPGSAISYDNHEYGRDDARHFAVGIVICNDGERITVLWPWHCKERIKTYEVRTLNHEVIRKVW